MSSATSLAHFNSDRMFVISAASLVEGRPSARRAARMRWRGRSKFGSQLGVRAQRKVEC